MIAGNEFIASKLPFSETQKAYREGVENLMRPMLDDPESELLKQLESGEAVYIGAGNRGVKMDKERLIPIALPIDYHTEKGRAETRHNITQIFLYKSYRFSNGELHEQDETPIDIMNYYSLSRSAVDLAVRHAFRDAHRQSSYSSLPLGLFELKKNKKNHSDAKDLGTNGSTPLHNTELVSSNSTYSRL